MNYDAVIIGTGQAGPSLARALAGKGYRTAIIESGNFGGTCVNTGCTPTKAYVASARRAHIARNSTDHGVTTGEVRVDLKVIRKRKDELVRASRDGLKEHLLNTDNLTVYEGVARLTGPHQVTVNDQTLEAAQIFLNVGGRPRIPEGFAKVNYLTNQSILELDEIPEHLIIVGGGYVGLEFAQMFRRFGSEVTIIEMSDRLLKKEDPEVSEGIREIFEQEGIRVRLKAECLSGKTLDQGVRVNIDCSEGEPQIRGSHMLIATGRVPNTEDLGLKHAGVDLDEKGYIHVNDRLQTNQSHIWALGDCNGKGAFTHTAYNDYQIVASQLFGDGSRKLSNRFLCYAVYVDPSFARVGMNATEIRGKGIHASVASMPMDKIARAKEKGETAGFLTIFIATKTDKILGAQFLGAGADEYIHSIIDLMYADASYTVLRDAMHIHPTVSELIPTMLENLETLDS